MLALTGTVWRRPARVLSSSVFPAPGSAKTTKTVPSRSNCASVKTFSPTTKVLGMYTVVIRQHYRFLGTTPPVDTPLFVGRTKSAVVQVFGRRADGTDHPLKRPATKKRHGTKSRRV